MSRDKQYIEIQRLLDEELIISSDVGRTVDLRRKEGATDEIATCTI